MYQTGRTIKDTLEQIAGGRFVLPAIQREFVWKPEQIYKFFDSLMQGYPFGTFLYWQVATENASELKFYEFMRHYHERDNRHCKPIEDVPNEPLTAVLDGQQRLTALNIGLRGTMKWKLPKKRWDNSSAFPERKLYLDLLSGNKDSEDGIRYRFEFLTDEQLSKQKENHFWFPVSEILQLDNAPEQLKWITDHQGQQHGKPDSPFKVLDKLFQVVHNHSLVLPYEEKGQDLEKVLNIFIRMNSGGTVLSYSDLLLSVAVAQWNKYDARDEIHNLVDELNSVGGVGRFEFSKDLVLKAGLMLSDIGNVGFKVENFTSKNMAEFESKWISIKEALLLTVRLLSSFGFSAKTISADSAILPIAYYLHLRKLKDTYLTHSSNREDRENIRQWFIKSLLKPSGIWGSGLDVFLTALRAVILDHGANHFPYLQIRDEMTRRGKSISFEPEEIEELADMSYGNKLSFALMSLIFPFVRNHYAHEIDHIFPKKRFTTSSLQKAGFEDFEAIEQAKKNSNKIANLQLLPAEDNNEKHTKMPLEWIEEICPKIEQRREYIRTHLLDGLPDNLKEFPIFYERRHKAIKDKIASILG